MEESLKAYIPNPDAHRILCSDWWLAGDFWEFTLNQTDQSNSAHRHPLASPHSSFFLHPSISTLLAQVSSLPHESFTRVKQSRKPKWFRVAQSHSCAPAWEKFLPPPFQKMKLFFPNNCTWNLLFTIYFFLIHVHDKQTGDIITGNQGHFSMQSYSLLPESHFKVLLQTRTPMETLLFPCRNSCHRH